MTALKYFNFPNFKAVMDVADSDETSYGTILRSIFSYIKKIYAIDLDATLSTTITTATSTSILVLPYSALISVGQLVQRSTEEVEIIDKVDDLTLLTTTITVSPALALLPANGTAITILLTLIPFDLQYAIYQHAKYLLDVQKKNLQIIDTVTDATGNKVTYKGGLSSAITSVYREYAISPMAFI